MHVHYRMTGYFPVPDGTVPLEGVANQFRLPTGEIISVHPVIEMASSADADDHRALRHVEAEAYGIAIDFYDRRCALIESD